ncbi:cache domain-containing protein [Amorphus sp. 3PC139-8]|uniref:cache domain-containing protein n=1 Tax=Amorphus sp. 3PC139-8 TaxID=2735676 RepID=UPI00345DC3F4
MTRSLLSGLCILAGLVSLALANEFDAPLKALAITEVASIASAPEVIAAVKAQNAETGGYDQAMIDAADSRWREEVGAAERPTIDAMLARPASAFLLAKKDSSSGLYTEIFVMDAKGLNVAQSDVTSDYWQGDEAKWQETFGKGAGSLHISDIEFDESSQTYQSQVSMPVVDNGEVIGALTIGVNVEYLQ